MLLNKEYKMGIIDKLLAKSSSVFGEKVTDRLWKTFGLPPALIALGCVGVGISTYDAIRSCWTNKAQDTAGEAGPGLALGIVVIIAIIIGFPLSFITGIPFVITAPVASWGVLAVVCNLF
jgi:hypothetical protein